MGSAMAEAAALVDPKAVGVAPEAWPAVEGHPLLEPRPEGSLGLRRSLEVVVDGMVQDSLGASNAASGSALGSCLDSFGEAALLVAA